MKTITAWVKNVKTAELVALYNLFQSAENKIKKFADRATAEKRLLLMMKDYEDFFSEHASAIAKIGLELPAPDEAELPAKKVAEAAKEAAAKEPEAKKEPRYEVEPGDVAPTAVEVDARKKASPVKAPDAGPAPKRAKKDSKTPPHLNLRCPVANCGYYAKSTPDMLKRARLKCPIDGSVLQTAEERGEARGSAKEL